MEPLISPVLKEYAWSALITFATAFFTVVAATPVPADQAAVFAIISVGFRAGFAALINLFATKFTTISSKPI